MRSRKTSPSTRWKGLFAAALSLALVLLAAAGYAEGWLRPPREAFPGGPPEEEGLTLYMADVGQGLAMLLQSSTPARRARRRTLPGRWPSVPRRG